MQSASLIAWTLSLILAGPPPADDAEPADAAPSATDPAPAQAGPPAGTTPTQPSRPAETDNPGREAGEAGPTESPEAEPLPDGGLDQRQVDTLRQEARSLRDDLFRARARVSQVTSKLFNSEVSVQLRSNLPRFYDVTDLTVTLDGAPVYIRETGVDQTGEPIVQLFAAPGSHEIGVSANLAARRDRTYTVRFDESFTFVVPEDSLVSARLRIRETGNMWRFAARKRGHYRFRTDLRTRAKAHKKRRAGSAPKPGRKIEVKAKAGGSNK